MVEGFNNMTVEQRVGLIKDLEKKCIAQGVSGTAYKIVPEPSHKELYFYTPQEAVDRTRERELRELEARKEMMREGPWYFSSFATYSQN